MYDYERIVTILKKNGWNDLTNISDFYFENRKKLDPIIYGPRVCSGQFASKVRWKSEIGIACYEAIRKYIDDKLKKKEEEMMERFRDLDQFKNDPDWYKHFPWRNEDIFAIIDFSDFQFTYRDQLKKLNDFVYSFDTERGNGQLDLIGIDLSNIKLVNCRLVNLAFGNANFDGASFHQVETMNVNFGGASFQNASIGTMWVDDHCLFINADMSGAAVYGIHDLSDKNLSEPFVYDEVSYLYLLRSLARAILPKKNVPFPKNIKRKHTAFGNNRMGKLTLPETRSLKEYVNWYQYTMDRVRNFKQMPFRKKLGFSLSLISTKHWSSYRALAFFAFIVNISFSIFYYYFSENFRNMNQDFMSAFYYSVVTFTTLGYGDISPLTTLGRFIVILEVIIGYIVLGLFVFLIGRMVERKY